jgi:carboxymethylenebutenolidase
MFAVTTSRLCAALAGGEQGVTGMDKFDELWDRAELDRRELIAAGAAAGFVAGFAMSVQPVAAQTIVLTDTTGLQAGMVEIPTGNGPIPAYSAAPAGAQKRPLVLVVQEIFGVHEHIKDVCRRPPSSATAP